MKERKRITRDLIRGMKTGESVTVQCVNGYDLGSQRSLAYAAQKFIPDKVKTTVDGLKLTVTRYEETPTDGRKRITRDMIRNMDIGESVTVHCVNGNDLGSQRTTAYEARKFLPGKVTTSTDGLKLTVTICEDTPTDGRKRITRVLIRQMPPGSFTTVECTDINDLNCQRTTALKAQRTEGCTISTASNGLLLTVKKHREEETPEGGEVVYKRDSIPENTQEIVELDGQKTAFIDETTPEDEGINVTFAPLEIRKKIK